MVYRVALRGVCALPVLMLVACQDEEAAKHSNNPVAITASQLSGGTTTYYASPFGSPTNLGTIASPWDLKTALNKTTVILSGDTLWLRGGTYNVPSSTEGFTSQLQGVVIINYAGERPTLDGHNLSRDENQEVLRVNGSSSFIRLEITDTYSSDRTSQRPHLLVNNASNTYYQELVIHDGGDSFYNFATMSHVTVRGCVIYNSGQKNDPLPAHGMYIKSNNSPGVWVDYDILFDQFGYGVHAYSDVVNEDVNFVNVTHTAIFNSGSLDSPPLGKANIIVGVGNSSVMPAAGNALTDNYTFKSPSIPGPNLYIGFETVPQHSINVARNWVAGGSQIIEAKYWDSLTFDHNNFIGASKMVALRNTNLSGLKLISNKHWYNPNNALWSFGTSDMGFTQWQTTVGASSDSAFGAVPGSQGVAVLGVVPGRAHVILYNNPQSLSWFTFNPPPYGIFAAGDSLEVRSVFDLFGRPVTGGRCCGSILIDNIDTPVPPVPFGMTGPAPTPGRAFAAYVVTKVPR